MKAYAYLRVSGLSQVSGDGFERQSIAVMAYANQNSIEIEQVFREEGVSGTKELENRPALQELFAALDADPSVKTILIENLSRLARDLMIQETIIQDLQKSGYTLISVQEPDLCQDDPSRKLMRQVFGALFEYERAMLVLKLRGARQRMKAKGLRVEGNKPFGFYSHENGAFESLMAFARDGMSAVAIAAELNARSTVSSSMKTRSGKPWSPAVVAKILRREAKDNLVSVPKNTSCA